jgi:Fe-S cluster assembly protein SufD
MDWQNNYSQFKISSALDSLRAADLRHRAFEKFSEKGLPTKKEEAWKFTSLKPFSEVHWTVHNGEETYLTHEQMQEVSKQLPSDFHNFVFVNGVLNKTLSDDADSLFEIKEVEESDFYNDQQHVEHNLLNLAHAFLNKKIILTVSKHKTVDRPVQILFVQSSKGSVFISEKLNVILEENSEIKLLVNSISFVNSTADAMNLNVNVKCAERSRLQFIQLQNEDTESFHFSQVQLELESGAQVSTLALTMGNKLTRNYLSLKFLGENASAQVYGLVVSDIDQHVDNYTFIQHAKGQNNSVQHYKSILSGSSHSVFRGRVLIEPNAQKANSEQLNNNLLLTRSAQADSIPQLEIFADDVKAGHGSTVGQLNKDEIFYFLSRGIDQYKAVKMLSYGYATELIYKFENPELQNFLIAVLNTKLEKMVQNG